MGDFFTIFIPFLTGALLGGVAVWLALRSHSGGEAHLTDAFKALAAQSLADNNERFLVLAREKLAQSEQAASATLERKSAAIDETLKPVKEALQKMGDQLQALEVKREGAYGELLNVVKLTHETHQQLRGETSQLLQALRSPTTRGSWGQMQLKRILEMTGMSAHTKDFTTQASLAENTLRPDFIVSLPGNRCVVFDSKVPFTAYMDMMNTADGATQQALLLQHAKQVKEQIKSLGAKEYWSQIETTPEFVVLFMPGDHLLGAALESDPTLMDYGVQQRVVLATPTTVIALLWAVAYGWKQEMLTENVRKVGSLGGELYSALAIMTKHFVEVGNKLGGSVKAYNDALGSFERNVMSKARRLRDYGAAKDGKALPDVLEPIDLQTRSLTASDTAANEDAA